MNKLKRKERILQIRLRTDKIHLLQLLNLQSLWKNKLKQIKWPRVNEKKLETLKISKKKLIDFGKDTQTSKKTLRAFTVWMLKQSEETW